MKGLLLMKLLSALLLISLTTAIGSAHAQEKACYSMTEAEAEQGIRIHSELMVIGLNCQHMWPTKDGQNLFQRYRLFTSEHANLFSGYDSTLLRFFIKNGYTNKQSEKKLNAIRTGVANRISNDAAKMRPDLFCKHYAPRIEQASKMPVAKIRKWAQTFFDSHPVSYPLCGASAAVKPQKSTSVPRKKYITAP